MNGYIPEHPEGRVVFTAEKAGDARGDVYLEIRCIPGPEVPLPYAVWVAVGDGPSRLTAMTLTPSAAQRVPGKGIKWVNYEDED